MLRFTANLSLLFNEVELIERFKAAKDAGFESVEIQFPYSLPPEIILQKLQQYDLKLVLFNIDADDLLQGGEGLAAVPEKQHRFQKAVEQTVKYARILKPQIINVLPGRSLDNNRNKEYLGTFKKNLSLAADNFSPLGINTVFEAVNIHDMPGFIIHTGRQMLDILEKVKRPDLLMQYDIYHMQMMRENTEGFISHHIDKIGHFHFADVPGRGQPGTGQIDFKRLFKLIDKSGYRRWIGAEYKPVGTTQNSLEWFNKMPL